ncbi:hypothetical protein QLX08_006533 [Tetragonisca angustula]|uniref:Uncharacterized protein n=1 Tax=Tetragonisca angustula TaxID=166442 RepID=A0AAW0ZTD6_9HYME
MQVHRINQNVNGGFPTLEAALFTPLQQLFIIQFQYVKSLGSSKTSPLNPLLRSYIVLRSMMHVGVQQNESTGCSLQSQQAVMHRWNELWQSEESQRALKTLAAPPTKFGASD